MAASYAACMTCKMSDHHSSGPAAEGMWPCRVDGALFTLGTEVFVLEGTIGTQVINLGVHAGVTLSFVLLSWHGLQSNGQANLSLMLALRISS